eukprot:3802729-Amphidinium_carterae.1
MSYVMVPGHRDAVEDSFNAIYSFEPLLGEAASSSSPPRGGGESRTQEVGGSYVPPSMLGRLVGDDLCVICFEPLRLQAQTIAICGHIFHRQCLNSMPNATCPHCRQQIDVVLDEDNAQPAGAENSTPVPNITGRHHLFRSPTPPVPVRRGSTSRTWVPSFSPFSPENRGSWVPPPTLPPPPAGDTLLVLAQDHIGVHVSVDGNTVASAIDDPFPRPLPYLDRRRSSWASTSARPRAATPRFIRVPPPVVNPAPAMERHLVQARSAEQQSRRTSFTCLPAHLKLSLPEAGVRKTNCCKSNMHE